MIYSCILTYIETTAHYSMTQFPDELSCSVQPTFPPVLFSLPPGPLVVSEGDSLTVCVTKEGETAETLSVRIATVSTGDFGATRGFIVILKK